jgi:hypothetical protein
MVGAGNAPLLDERNAQPGALQDPQVLCHLVAHFEIGGEVARGFAQ